MMVWGTYLPYGAQERPTGPGPAVLQLALPCSAVVRQCLTALSRGWGRGGFVSQGLLEDQAVPRALYLTVCQSGVHAGPQSRAFGAGRTH